MKSDIILNDESVEIIGDVITMKTRLPEPGFKMQNYNLTVGVSTVSQSASIEVTDKSGKTRIRSYYVSSNQFIGEKVKAEKIYAQEIEVGPTASDSPQISKVVVKNKQGVAAITLDGENEDIILKAFGSLTAKIRKLEYDISILKSKLP